MRRESDESGGGRNRGGEKEGQGGNAAADGGGGAGDGPLLAGDQIRASGRFLDFVVREGWEFAARKRIAGIVGIVAVTPEGALLLTEQYRPPVACRVCELPAGLIGDAPASREEDLIGGASRELLEETGYVARQWRVLARGTASPGTTSEVMHLLLASGLERRSAGGGVEGESIQVHEVPLEQVEEWLVRREAEGVMIDLKIFAGLYFAREWVGRS